MRARRRAMWLPIVAIGWLASTTARAEIPVDGVLDKAYGRLDTAKGCRPFEDQGMQACMKVDRIDRLDTDTGPRVYVILTGEVADAGHVSPGLIGAWVIDAPKDQVHVIASVRALPMGASGMPPTGWQLLKLSKSDYWGWYNTTGDMHQGYAGSFHSILAPFGKTVRELALFTGSYSDEGACGDAACEKKSSDIDSKLVVDDRDATPKVYPLSVTVTGRSGGKPLTPKTWTVPFDTRKWKYVPPKNWPLADRDF